MSMRIRLSDERRGVLVDKLTRLFGEEFDEELSSFRAERIVEFFVRTLGPQVYNQAIGDARSFLQEKLDDLDAEFYEVEE